MSKKIVERISNQAGVEDLVEILATRLPGSELQSLLIEVYRSRAHQRSTADVLADYERNRFTRFGNLDPLALASFDQSAFGMLPPGFERVTLSPLVPLGTTAAVADLDPALAIATVRNTEVISDSTNAMALECAVRRRALLRADRKSPQCVRLASSQRLVRPQLFDGPLRFAHFQAFALVTAGRDTGSKRFESEHLAEHIGFYTRLVCDGLGVPADRIRVALTPLTDADDALVEPMIAQLRGRAGGARFEVDRQRSSGRNYYEQACFKLFAADSTGHEVELADGGFVPWTRRLLSDRKERLMISGVGAERACQISGEALTS